MTPQKLDLDLITRKVARRLEGPPFVPFEEWYGAWEYFVDGAYTIGLSLFELQKWLCDEYLEGESGVIHLEPITRRQAEADMQWLVESFNDGGWEDYCELDELLNDHNQSPFDQFRDEVKYVVFSCDPNP